MIKNIINTTNKILKDLNSFKEEIKQERKKLEKEYENYKKDNQAYTHPLYYFKDPKRYLETIDLINESINDASTYFSEDGVVLTTFYLYGVSDRLITIAEKNNMYVYMLFPYLKYFVDLYISSNYMEIIEDNAKIFVLDKVTNQLIEKDGFKKLKINKRV